MGERLQLSTVETTLTEGANRPLNALPLSEVLGTIRATVFPRPHVLLILDCCFAGLSAYP